MNTETANLNAVLTLLPLGAVLLLPGFIWHAVTRKIVPGRGTDRSDRAGKILAYSILCFVIWAKVFPGALPSTPISDLAGALQIAANAALFLVPISVLGGIVTGLFEREDCFRKILRLIRIQSASTGMDPWSRAFLRPIGCLVRIRYSDGGETYGIFNPKSVASDPSESKEIYLEQVFCINADGDLEPAVASQGCWISADFVREIQFIDAKELESDDAKTKCATDHSHSEATNRNGLANRSGRQDALASQTGAGSNQADCESNEPRQGIEVNTVSNRAGKQESPTLS